MSTVGVYTMIPRFLFYLTRLKRHLRLSTSELRELQLLRLRTIVRHAYDTVPFYHRKFRLAGVRPDDVKSLSDLSKLPITTKSEVQVCSFSDIVSRSFPASACSGRITSGSTGIPLVIYVNKNVLDFEGAVWIRALFENGLRLRDKMAVICDPRSFPRSRSFTQRFGVMRSRYFSIFDTIETHRVGLSKYRPDVLKGYPSSLLMLADACHRGPDGFNPRLVFSSAELLDNGSRKLISSAFNAELLDNYACSEFSLLAWECHEHKGYHVNVDSVVMEFVDDDEAVAVGERGEILCTGLHNVVMPLLRYRLGDVGVPDTDMCSCGRTFPLIRIVEGRADDFLMATDGRKIPPTVFFPYPFESFEEIKQFRVIQEKKDVLRIQLVGHRLQMGDEMFDKARVAIRRIFGENMQVEFELLPTLPCDLYGKPRKVVSMIDSGFAGAMKF